VACLFSFFIFYLTAAGGKEIFADLFTRQAGDERQGDRDQKKLLFLLTPNP